MSYQLFQIDAFTKNLFTGNPACVVPVSYWPSDEIMLQIAKENAVAETAYIKQLEMGKYHLRWFTPDIEMDLCGHATLAAAHAIKTIINDPSEIITFETMSGALSVSCDEMGRYWLDFPSRPATEASLPSEIMNALSIQPKEVLKARDYLLIYETEEQIRQLEIDRAIIDQINLGPGGVIVSALGNDSDFVSRFFTPQATFLEDPVTGSAHCTLIPYWSENLNKTTFAARQLSERGGELACELHGDRVHIGGYARTYSIGRIESL